MGKDSNIKNLDTTNDYISIGTLILPIKGEISDPDIKYKNGEGYVKDDIVWAFTVENAHKGDNRYPYFWKTEDENGNIILEFSNPPMDILEMANIVNKVNMDKNKIIEDSSDAEFNYTEEELNDMNSATKKFIPTINESDDFLKKLIKNAILEKNIDINRIKSKVARSYQLFNMRSALIGNTKMSVKYFMQWCEMLGIDFKLTISDNGVDYMNPLQHKYTYYSHRNVVVEDDEEDEDGDLL